LREAQPASKVSETKPKALPRSRSLQNLAPEKEETGTCLTNRFERARLSAAPQQAIKEAAFQWVREISFCRFTVEQGQRLLARSGERMQPTA